MLWKNVCNFTAIEINLYYDKSKLKIFVVLERANLKNETSNTILQRYQSNLMRHCSALQLK